VVLTVYVIAMQLQGHTVLVTGGATGIGLAIAERFLEAGSDVIICGRRESALREAQVKHPRLHTRVCDLADASQRVALADWAVREHPTLDVLVNNAGIQHRLDLTQGADWPHLHREIATNFEAHVHLAMLLIPHLRAQRQPAIVNVTSGLAFVPRAAVPVYSATKAAMRSFTVSLRTQLSKTAIRVIEVIPPAVDTDLGGPGLHTWGVPLKEFVDATCAKLGSDEDLEIPYGFAAEASRASRDEIDAMTERMNGPG
jgi:uncharacterized oxidoreductase